MPSNKKKTSVTLPGGIQNLVRSLQSGKPAPVAVEQVQQEEAPVVEPKSEEQPSASQSRQQGRVEQPRQSEQPQQQEAARQGQQPESASQQPANTHDGDNRQQATVIRVVSADEQSANGNGQNQSVNQYDVIVDDSEDAWRMFLDTAEQYKHGDSNLATIYIDEQLKNILDRLKYAGKEKLTTSAILSSIVARFIYDHRERIEKILFGGKLM
jgi:hypothetical protein